MPKNLVIVESPAKAHTIERYLGEEYQVKASLGHIIDLPERELAIDIKNNFAPDYRPLPGKEKTIDGLKSAGKNADTIYLACDPDREGETIAYHVASLFKNKPTLRVLFNEITKHAIQQAMEKPGQIDLQKVDAQQARRILDRLIGYLVSPILQRTISKGLSAGRVQTVALRLIVEREQERRAFVPEEYWKIEGLFETPSGDSFKATLEKVNNKKVKISDKSTADKLIKDLKKCSYSVKSITDKESIRKSPPPFITSTLQQEANSHLGLTSRRTMQIAQRLYEGVELGGGERVGLITYMRTDSTRLAQEAIDAARVFIKGNYGARYLPASPPQYKSKRRTQDAHEAIRPTDVNLTPDKVKQYLDNTQFKLYSLIWRRFVASQMNPARMLIHKVEIEGGKYVFLASAVTVLFDGFFRVYPESAVKEQTLPRLTQGMLLKLLKLNATQHFTQPPPRYSEATLIKALEENGIGRPSTYATIVGTLFERSYVEKQEGKLVPTDLGETVTKLLVQIFPDLFNVAFTANMEEELDEVERGKLEWVKVVREFYEPFSETLTRLNDNKTELKKAVIEETDQICPVCGKQLIIRWGRTGRFIGCTGYPECTYTSAFGKEKEIIEKLQQQYKDAVCEACGSKMVVRKGRGGYFLGCSSYPKCKNIRPVTIETGIKCPKCDKGVLKERHSRTGKVFYSCSNYPKCDYSLWDKPVAQACPNCDNYFLVETKKGLVCPKCKIALKTEDAEQISE